MRDFVEYFDGWDGHIFEEVCEEIREIIGKGLDEGTSSEPRKLNTEEFEDEAWWQVYRDTDGRYRYEEFCGKPDDVNDIPYLVIWEKMEDEAK